MGIDSGWKDTEGMEVLFEYLRFKKVEQKNIKINDTMFH